MQEYLFQRAEAPGFIPGLTRLAPCKRKETFTVPFDSSAAPSPPRDARAQLLRPIWGRKASACVLHLRSVPSRHRRGHWHLLHLLRRQRNSLMTPRAVGAGAWPSRRPVRRRGSPCRRAEPAWALETPQQAEQERPPRVLAPVEPGGVRAGKGQRHRE